MGQRPGMVHRSLAKARHRALDPQTQAPCPTPGLLLVLLRRDQRGGAALTYRSTQPGERAPCSLSSACNAQGEAQASAAGL